MERMNAPDKVRPSFPFSDLQAQYRALKSEIDARIQRVLDHGQYIMGPEVGELEAALSAYTQSRHCVTVASGTEALLIALMAAGIKADDEVITTDFSFAATAEVIVLLGAKPVFVDVEPNTCNIDVAQVERHVNARTRAIIPVSLYGQCADMDEINAIAAREGVVVIEDAAQSFGATYKRRKSCNLSTIGCTSFFPSKPLGCYGDGGALFTNDDALAQACREIRIHGQSGRYHHTRVGVGGRMDTLQCAVVLAKLRRFDWELQQRQEIAARYRSLLRDVTGIETLAVRSDRSSAWAQYSVLVEQRAKVQAALAEHGIPTVVHYPRPLHLQPAFAQHGRPDDNPVSRRVAQQVLSLPMSADLGADDQFEVVRQLESATRQQV
jgi:UDP-2-acetamido-2-deoxy-ribo-hexuluronate aminotransferase